MLAEHRVRLDEMGGALRSCRALFCRMWGQGFYEPSTTGPSAAWSDFQLLLAGPDGTLWPTDLRRQPRSTAIKLLHQQADYCAALGLLVTAGEVADPASTLVRALIEYAARGYWILDPDPTVDHRGRCARAVLFELVSLSHARDAATKLPTSPELDASRAEAKTAFQAMKKAAEARFLDVILVNDPAQWSIEGQRYLSWTAIAEAWSAAHDTGVNGAALYKLLALLAHPQAYSATFGLHFDKDGVGTRILTITWVEKLVQLALVAFYSSLTLVANYLGHRPKELVNWEDDVEKILPSIFVTTPGADSIT